ncbi:hypothetical protein D3C75_1320410 [compost metagenome]
MEQAVQIAAVAQLFAPIDMRRIAVHQPDDIAHAFTLKVEYSLVLLYPNRHGLIPSLLKVVRTY